MKNFFPILVLLIANIQFSLAQTVTIAAARAQGAGAVVTVEGIVLNSIELGNVIRYIQDGTGAMALYGNNIGGAAPGMLVRTTGTLVNYRGICEMTPVSAYTSLSSGNPLPAPILGTPADVTETNEGKQVTIPNCTFAATGNFTYNAGGYVVNSGGQSFTVFFRNGHPLLNTPIPTLPIELTGIVSQFDMATTDFNAVTTGYQLLPRTASDFAGFFITSSVAQSNTTASSFNISWTSNLTGLGGAKYTLPNGTTGFLTSAAAGTMHSLSFSGLQPADIVRCKAYAVKQGTTDTAFATPSAHATISTSTGAINAYFNRSVDNSVSTGVNANYLAGQDLENFLISKINAVVNTIDVSVYNAGRVPIVLALNNAKNRGVRVRYIYDIDETNSSLTSATFPILGVNAVALMHNKFFVFDAENAQTCLVWTGSTNLTDGQIFNDYNNVITLQDQSLARAYVIEFEEMWGSNTAAFNDVNSRVSSDKKDNTPHYFVIGGTPVECFFSPSDGTNNKIAAAIGTANTTLEFALLTFTSAILGTAVRDAQTRGVVERGLVDNINDTGSQIPFLISNNIDVRDAALGSIFHHKYCLIDATNPSSDPTVVTGSHNWSNSADSRNDENTLIVHSASIANQYLQEFTARWTDVTATLNAIENLNGLTATVLPNPIQNNGALRLNGGNFDGKVLVHTFDNTGKRLATETLNYTRNTSTDVRIDATQLASGSYFMVVEVDGRFMGRKVTVIK